MKSSRHILVTCPTCGEKVPYEGNPYRPFCSRGCKGVDLIHWTEESYRIQKDDNDDNDNKDREDGE